MVEQQTKRDVLAQSQIAYIGDDTGLIKKVKVVAKRTEETNMIRYDVAMPARRKVDAQGNEVVIERRKNGALDAADN
jgi:hypothetical protein